MKPRSIMDGDLGFTMDDRQDGGYAIWLTVVAGVVIPEPALVYSSDSQRDSQAVFRALNGGLTSAIESAGMVAALRMADSADDVMSALTSVSYADALAGKDPTILHPDVAKHYR